MQDRRKTHRLVDEGKPDQPTDASSTPTGPPQAGRSGHVQVIDGHNVWNTAGLEDTQQLMSFLDNPELALEDDSPSPETSDPGNPYNSTGGKALGWRKPGDGKKPR